jgi:hypothetical protein
MLRPRWRKVLRDTWLHRGRTALVVLAIAIGLAGAGVILNAWALVDVATREGYGASNPALATLRVDSVDHALLERVSAMLRCAWRRRDGPRSRACMSGVQRSPRCSLPSRTSTPSASAS